MFESSILSGEAVAYQPTGNEREILVKSADGSNHVWHKVQAVCWEHGPEEEEGLYEPTLVGFWVVGGGLRRRTAVIFGR